MNGTAVYHDVLPAAGKRFVDMAQFPRALGFEVPWTWPRKNNGDSDSCVDSEDGKWNASSRGRSGQEDTARCARVIRLDFLLGDVVGRLHGLDFRTFRANDRLQPLHVLVRLFSILVSVCISRDGKWKHWGNRLTCLNERGGGMHMQIITPTRS